MTPRRCFLAHDLLAAATSQWPDKVALVCGDHRYTYRDLDERSTALARVLVERGVDRGDRVIVFAENGLVPVVAFWAVLKANAIVVIVHGQTRPTRLVELLEDCRPRALVTELRLEHSFAEPARSSPHLATVIVAGADEVGRARLAGLPGVVGFEEVCTAARHEAPPPRRSIELDLAAIIYTSGSTGEPKGVMLTHRNMLAATASISAYLPITGEDVILDVLPLAFSYGLYQILLATAAGARVVLEPSFVFPAQILQLVARERVTGFPGVPTMFTTLLGMGTLEAYDLSSIRFVTNAAAALSASQLARIQATFPTAQIFSMYGLTECNRCSYLPPADLARKPESVGIAIPNTELWLIDEHGTRLGPNQVGELVIRGATVMRGYWEKPEATARKLRPGPVPGELVLHTGDLCRLDDEGYLYFVGRMDEVIKSRGEKVAPMAVEWAILAIPGVREAAVIGVPHEVLGQAIKAFVVLEAGAILDATTIQRECKSRLEAFMVPTIVELRDDLPKSSNGKIHKPTLARPRSS